MAGVTGQIEGRDLGSVMVDVQRVLLNVMIAALLLVFILLLFLYGRFRVAKVLVVLPASLKLFRAAK